MTDDVMRMKFWMEKCQGAGGFLVNAVNNLVSASKYYEQTACYNTAGDANANGTSLGTITIEIDEICIGVEFMGAANVPSLIRVGTGALATPPTDYDWIAVNTTITGKMSDGSTPLFIINNVGGGAALTLRAYAPRLQYVAVVNNPITSYFYMKLGVLNIPIV